jgi:hypothetical protein
MTYWIREFEHSESGKRFRVYAEEQYVPALRKRVAKQVGDDAWLDDQLYRHDAGLDIRLEGEHPFHVDGLTYGEMPLKTAEQLEAECIRLLRMNVTTRDIQRVGIVRTKPKATEANWTYGELSPEPTAMGRSDAAEIITSVAGRWALAD